MLTIAKCLGAVGKMLRGPGFRWRELSHKIYVHLIYHMPNINAK